MPSEKLDKLDRRRLLQVMAGGMGGAITGCLSDGGDGDGDEESPTDDGTDDGSTDPTDTEDDGSTDPTDTEVELDYEDGGRLEFGIERPDIGNYDLAESSLADDSMVFSLLYDGLFVQDPEGEMYNWMAETYEATDANDVSTADYTDYMAEYEITGMEEGVPEFDIEWPNTVLMQHPDDAAALANEELGEGDQMRVLTRNEAPDAVEDGVYGTKVEGRLHEGIQFHNGSECTAGDIVGSYDRFVDSANEGQIFDSFLYAEAPNGDDGYDFVLYSQSADAIADVELPPTWIFPQEHHDIEPGNLDPRADGPVPVGTGPYEISEFEQGSQLLFERTDPYWLEEVGLDNKEWWDGPEDFPERPPIQEVNIRFVPEGGTRVAALREGDLDISYQLPAGERTNFDEDSDFTVVSAQSTGFQFMTFSLEDTEEGGAFAEKQARHAVNNLIPRQSIVDVVAQGWGSPARAPIPAPAAGAGSTMSYEELQEQDWSYPDEPDADRAEELLNETDLETPVTMILETNADDAERQDKVSLIVDQLNQSGLFEAEMETPADITPWILQNLYVQGSHEDYAQRNAVTFIGLAAGFDPHGYLEALHHPNNHNGCCNWHFGEGTFDWIDDLDACRYGADVAQDPDLRRQRYDELYPQVVDSLGTTIVDYSLETAVAGPDVQGYAAYPDRRGFLDYSIYAPYNESFAWLDR